MARFQLTGLSPERFAPLFSLSDRQLAELGARRVVADAHPGYPCRVSLVDAQPGDELLLLPYEHQPANSPYRASGPIYVRQGAMQRTLVPGEITDSVATRLMSLPRRATSTDRAACARARCAVPQGAAARSSSARHRARRRGH